MNTAKDQIGNEVSAIFERLFAAGHFTDEQKKQLNASLEEAVVLRSITEIINTLSEDDKAKCNEQTFEHQEDLLLYLEGLVPRGQFDQVVGSSVAHVINNFFEKMLSKNVA